MSVEFDALAAQAAKNSSVELSAIAVLNDLVSRIEATAGDREASLALAASLKDSADQLSESIAAVPVVPTAA